MTTHPGFRTQREERSGVRLPVEGDLPDWLTGRYVQNGPGQFEVGGERLGHWFDPLAMVRAFAFDDGVTYTNRFVRSDDFAFAREHGRVRTPFPGTPAQRPLWTRVKQLLTGGYPDNPIIGIGRIDGELAAITESPVALTLDPETLATTGRIDLTDGLDVDLTLGHPHYDPRCDALVNLGVSYGRDVTYTLFRRNGGATETVAHIDVADSPYIHSFALTERYAVLPSTPFGMDPTSMLAGTVTGDSFLDAFTSFDRPARFVVVDRATGDVVARPRADPFACYHHANAFEDGDDLVVDLVAFPDDRAVTALTLDNLEQPSAAFPVGDLVRFRLPLDGGRARRETLLGGPVEFPVIHYPDRLGREHGVVYAAGFDGSALPSRLLKVAVPEGRTQSWSEPGCHPGEPVFVPAPDARTEDDGVLLSLVLNGETGETFLAVIDARTMEERARATLPHRLPYGFHGQFYGPTSPHRSMA